MLSILRVFGALVLALALLPGVAVAQEQPEEDEQEEAPDRSGLEHACPEGEVPPSGFTDIAGNTHERPIECAAWWEITAGGPAGLPPTSYGPTLEVRRDQMASFIARMIDEAGGFPLFPWDGNNRFEDVDEDNVHIEAINRLAQVGIVEGREDGTYGPTEPVRRDQMASFIGRALEHIALEPRSSDEDQFEDVDEDNPHREYINGLALEGIVMGVAAGEYAPERPVRRDAMAAFVMRGLDLMTEEGPSSPPEAEEPDEPEDESPEQQPEDEEESPENGEEEEDPSFPLLTRS